MMRSVLILTKSEPIELFQKTGMELLKKYPGEFSLSVYESGLLDEDEVLREKALEEVRQAEFVMICLHGTVTNFKSFPKFHKFLGNQKLYFHTGMEEEQTEMAGLMNLSPDQYRMIGRYYGNQNEKNLKNLFLYTAASVVRCREYAFEDPDFPKWQGIYDQGRGLTEEEEAAYIKEIEEAEEPVIGILFHWNSYMKKDTRHIEALMKEIRRIGAMPYCIYSQMAPDEEQGFGGIQESLHRYFYPKGKVLIQVLINLTSFSVSVVANPGNGSKAQETSVFERLGVHVLQVMTSTYNWEEWKAAPAGIDPMMLSMQVFQPEFDGQIITWPFAYTEKIREKNAEKNISLPIAERVESICRLAYNWAVLSRIPMKDKRIAIIFHNMPPRNDKIGCATGLDTPESVYEMVQALKKEGLKLDYDFRDGQEIIGKIIAGVTNDGRWSSEEQLLEKSIDTVDKERYLKWFHSFTEKVQKELVRDWGTPTGEYMAIQDQILIPGILNGNLFIGLQPPRALMEKAEELFHNQDFVCPHQYLAFYRWIEDVFGANAVVHVGTHGSLEWLPGREVGLDNSSYPDVAIGTLPNLYPYIISNPGEGTQAKRRGSAAILDHLIPSFVESGTYDELTDLDGMLKEYYHFMLVDKSRTEEIAGQIWKACCEIELNRDLELTEEMFLENPEECIDKIHAWTSVIQSHEIRDGLHIYGKNPEGDQLRNMMRVLLRVENGEICSLRNSICQACGVSMDELLEHPAHLRPDGMTNAMLREELDECGRQMFIQWEKLGYEREAIPLVVDEELLKKAEAMGFQCSEKGKKELYRTLQFAADEIKPRIEKTTNELDAFLDGFNGKFISPGQSGCPTRGNVRLLPTGRNFYSIDPSAIPTRTAWTTGVRLGDQLLERCVKSDGKIPESVAILVYATDTMRNTGDDIAEIMYLFGIRPVWLGNCDRVIGMEVISLEELGRPRIDVTLRITGLMRDTFPNLIEKIEDAVNLVASLDEPHDKNYIKKHIDTEIEEFMKEGLSHEQAFDRASLRIFGCPPGTYGAGVKELVYAKKWDTSEDLGKVFTAWSCHAYGKKLHGEKRYDDFARRLSRTDVSIKNEVSIETDMLGSDDFFNYYGGLACAVNTHSGKVKPAYIANTSDKDRPSLDSLHEEASKIMRARINNPKWIEGLKRHGYKGAQDISGMVDIVFGWDATTHVIDDWMYKAIADRYVFQKENADWIREVNLFAMQNITERLLEASARGMWNASEEDLEKLRDIYMDVEGDIEGMNE